MNSSKPNNWNRPWSVEEMKENAENWSLAGDVALLNTIQAFSEVGIQHCTQKRFLKWKQFIISNFSSEITC